MSSKTARPGRVQHPRTPTCAPALACDRRGCACARRAADQCSHVNRRHGGRASAVLLLEERLGERFPGRRYRSAAHSPRGAPQRRLQREDAGGEDSVNGCEGSDISICSSRSVMRRSRRGLARVSARATPICALFTCRLFRAASVKPRSFRRRCSPSRFRRVNASRRADVSTWHRQRATCWSDDFTRANVR